MKKLILITLFALLPSISHQTELSEAQNIALNLGQQIECMAKNIYYESATEPYEGKLAVAQVTINRTNNRNFPSDFCSVVFQRDDKVCQFSWTCMQAYAKHPDEYIWEECMHIANMAMKKTALHKELATTL